MTLSAPSKLRYWVVCPYHTTHFASGAALLSTAEYARTLTAHATWADEHGIEGMIIYAFHSSLDPFACAGAVLQSSRRIRPVVTILPHLQHPIAAAKAISTLVYLYGRGVNLNMVAGASPADQERLGEVSDKARNLARLAEYIAVLRQALLGNCSFQGDFYRLQDVMLVPRVPEELLPNIFVPGSSEGSAAVTRAHADSSLLMAKPIAAIASEVTRLSGGRAKRHAMIVGVVARETAELAWVTAREQFAGDRRGRMAAQMFVAASQSQQHRTNLELAKQGEVQDGLLWYGAARLGIDCPKLVGSYADVARALDAYARVGITDVVFDLPTDEHEYEHIARIRERSS